VQLIQDNTDVSILKLPKQKHWLSSCIRCS